MGIFRMRSLKSLFSRFTSMTALVALLTTGFVAMGDGTPAHAGTVTTDSYGTLNLPYSYSGTIATTDCANPARGAGFYGDLFTVASNTTTRLYMATGWDSFLQVLDSNKTTIISQDDDSGAGVDAYMNSATVNTNQFIVATSYGQGGTGSYVLHSDVPLTQVTSCPQVISVSAPSSIVYGATGSMTATTNMNQTVTVTSQTPSVCSVASAAPNFTITPLATGTCSLVSSQAGNGSIQGAASVTSTITITAKTLSITGLNGDKNYDGNTTVPLTGTATLSGVVGADAVSLTGTATGTYNTANAGTNTITVSGLSLTGAQASRYTLSNTFTGVISKINQTISWSPTTTLNTTNTGSSFTAATTTTGGGTISYSIANAGTTGCTVVGTALSYVTSGTCVVRATAASNTNYNVATSDVTFTISKVNQTITWSPLTTLLAIPNSTILSAATTSGNGAITYSIASAGTTGCSITGTTLSYTSSGTCQVTASAAATNAYNSATSTLTFTINKAAQAALTVNAANSTLTYIAGPLATTTVSTSGGSGTGAVGYAVASASTTVCSISGTTVTALTAGSCVIEATKVGDGNYLDKVGSVTITINKGVQAPVVVSATNSTLNYQADPLATTTLSSTGGSTSGAVNFTVAGSSSSICSVSGNTVTALAAGNCVINATKVGDSNYLDRVDSITIVIDKALQSAFTVDAQSLELQYQSSPASTTTLSTSGGSGTGAVTFLVQAGSNSVCSISGTTVTALTAGSCVITASKAADANYAVATASVTITISKVAQAALSLTAATTSLTYRSTPALTTTISAAGGSGTGLTTYAVDAGSSTICSVAGTTVTVLGAGSCVVTAVKAGDTNYDSRSASVTIEIAKAAQATLVSSASATSLDYSQISAATTTLSTTGGNGTGVISYAPTPESVEVCSVEGNTLTALSAGTCVIQATKAESANYLAKTATVTVTINKISQVDFALNAGSTSLTYAASPANTTTIAATGGNGDGAISIAVSQSSSTVCSLSNGIVTALSAGTCVVEATKAGSTNYLSASDSISITIAKANQTPLVAASTHNAITITGGNTTTTLSYTGGSGTGAATWTLDASSVGICSLVGTTVTAVASGSCVVNLTKAASVNYLVATDSITIAVSAALQGAVTISAAETSMSFSATDLTFTTVSFTGGNGTGRIWFETTDPSKCVVGAARNTVAGIRATVTALHAGTCEVRGHKDGDANFAPAESSAIEIVVAKGTQSELSLSLESPLTYSVNPIASTHLRALGGSGSGSVSYSLLSGPCTLVANELSAPNAGDCVVRATKAADQDFNEVVVESTFTVAKAGQAALSLELAEGSISTLAWDGKKIGALVVSGGTGSGALSATTNSVEICTVSVTGSNVSVTGVAAGTCTVTVSKATSTNYLAKSSTFEFTVIDLPTAPSNVTITNTGVVTDDGPAVEISWSPIASTGTQAEVAGYEVQFKNGLNWVRADGGLLDAQTTSLTVYPTPWTALFIRVAPVSNFDAEDGVRHNWTNYTGTTGGSAPVAFNIAGRLDNISSPIVAASSGEPVIINGTDFDQTKTNQVEITTTSAVLPARLGVAAVTTAVKSVPAIVISPTKLSFVVPKITLPTGSTQLAATVRVLSTSGVRSEPVSFNYVPKKLAQTIAVSGLPTSSNLVVGTAVNGNLGALGAIPAATGTANICSVTIGDNGALGITPIAKGKCVVTIQAPATPGYAAAPSKVLNFTVLGVAQTINFVDPADRPWSAESFTLPVTAGSNLPVAVTSTTPLICSVADLAVTMLKSGVCTLKATQSGSAGFEAAAPVTQSFTIAKANRSANLTATIQSLAVDGTEADVVIAASPGTPTQANVTVAIDSDPLDRVVTLSQREGTVLFTVDSADDAAGRCVADAGTADSLEGVITLTDLGSCKVTISQPADDRFNAGVSVVIWINAVAINSNAAVPNEVETGDAVTSTEDTDTTPADPDSDPAVALTLPGTGGTFDVGGDVGIGYNPTTGVISITTKTAFVGTFKVTMNSPAANKKWFTVSKKAVASCALTLTVKKDTKLKTSVVRVIGPGCALSPEGKAALTTVGIQKLKISYVFNRAYAKTGLAYMGTAKAKTRILAKVKRTIVLNVGRVS